MVGEPTWCAHADLEVGGSSRVQLTQDPGGRGVQRPACALHLQGCGQQSVVGGGGRVDVVAQPVKGCSPYLVLCPFHTSIITEGCDTEGSDTEARVSQGDEAEGSESGRKSPRRRVRGRAAGGAPLVFSLDAEDDHGLRAGWRLIGDGVADLRAEQLLAER